jgi:PleD family two-component response regulator
MDRVRENVERLALPQGTHVARDDDMRRRVVTISVGIAELEGQRSSAIETEAPQAWVDRADKALYRAKTNGRNCVEVDNGPRAGDPIAAKPERARGPYAAHFARNAR